MITLYKWMLQLFGWNVWVAKQPEGLQASAAQFQKQFNTIGVSAAAIVLILLVLIGVALYYWWSNGSSKIFKYRHRIHWWLIWLFSSSVIVSAVTPITISFLLRDFAFKYNDALVAVSICNFLYAIILFIVLSIFASKCASKQTNASCTPF